jgi:PleD family two-component response regulator
MPHGGLTREPPAEKTGFDTKELHMPKILVVDDERSIREMLDIYLKREGYDVRAPATVWMPWSSASGSPLMLLLPTLKCPGWMA